MKNYLIIGLLMIAKAISLNAEYSWELDKKLFLFKLDICFYDSNGNLICCKSFNAIP